VFPTKNCHFSPKGRMERTGNKRRRRNWRQRGAWGLSFLGAGIVFANKMPFSKKNSQFTNFFTDFVNRVVA
jgi:hypothetical protein